MALDTFNAADADPKLGVDLTWTNTGSNIWRIFSNTQQATPLDNGSARCFARCEYNIANVDHVVQATVYFWLTVGGTIGICARYAAAADTYYLARIDGDSNHVDLFSVTAGVQSLISSQPFTPLLTTNYVLKITTSSAPSHVKVEIDGTTYIDLDDATITTGTRGGICADVGGSSVGQWDDWSITAVGGAGDTLMAQAIC